MRLSRLLAYILSHECKPNNTFWQKILSHEVSTLNSFKFVSIVFIFPLNNLYARETFFASIVNFTRVFRLLFGHQYKFCRLSWIWKGTCCLFWIVLAATRSSFLMPLNSVQRGKLSVTLIIELISRCCLYFLTYFVGFHYYFKYLYIWS